MALAEHEGHVHAAFIIDQLSDNPKMREVYNEAGTCSSGQPGDLLYEPLFDGVHSDSPALHSRDDFSSMRYFMMSRDIATKTGAGAQSQGDLEIE